MKIGKIAIITALVLSSFAANNVAPSKTELETMYDKAFRAFESTNYAEALSALDAIDARQPDLAESQNLRGVILMRQGDYDKAEAALQRALKTDPKFWNARFNLAEIPFLKKDWPEARKRFEALLASNASELQGEAAQLIQYKILLTYLLEGKDNMVDSILSKFELSPDSPAVQYANAAVAFQHKNDKEARDLLAAAEKKFSPQLNRLFAESLYEIGWLQKPAGQTRAALQLNSAADRLAKAKALAQAKLDQARQAFEQRDFTAARKFVDEADAADPNQAVTLNLRGEILLEQKEWAQAEEMFNRAIKADAKFRTAQYNLALVPFRQKNYAKARERFEALFSASSGSDSDSTAQLAKFGVYLTFLLEGKDNRAQKMMEQFQFTGDTPALYYAQAAWEFKHNNTAKATDWVTSARKIYPAAINLDFARSLYDLGWMQNPATAAGPGTAVAENAPVESTPSIEPTPIAGATAANKNTAAAAKQSPAKETNVAGMEATTSTATETPAASKAAAGKSEQVASAPSTAVSPSVETPVASTASPAASAPVAANMPDQNTTAAAQSTDANGQQGPATAAPVVATTASATPATVLAPAKVREWSQPSIGDSVEQFTNPRALLVGGLLLGGVVLLAWVLVSEVRRRGTGAPLYSAPAPAAGPRFDTTVQPEPQAQLKAQPQANAAAARLAGGPPRVSLQLKASEPSLRRAAVPLGKSGRGTPPATPPVEAPAEPVDNVAASVAKLSPAIVETPEETRFSDAGVSEPVTLPEPIATAEPSLGALREPATEAETELAANALPDVAAEIAPAAVDMQAPVAAPAVAHEEIAQPSEPAPVEATPLTASFGNFAEPAVDELAADEVAETPALRSDTGSEFYVPVTTATPHSETATPPAAVDSVTSVPDEVFEARTEEVKLDAPVEAVVPPAAEPISEIPAQTFPQAEQPAFASDVEADLEPIGQGQPIPYQTPAFFAEAAMADVAQAEPQQHSSPPAEIVPAAMGVAGLGALRGAIESPAFAPEPVSAEPPAQPTTTPAIMAQPTTPTTPAPVIRTPTTPGAMPQQASGAQPSGGGMHTAVQLTFSFEIASLQLTSSFKMGALQLRPTSKIVTMRLAPSQQPQPAMNLQVTFEIATVQLAGGALGTIRLTPSQQQRPGVISTPGFNISGLQIMPGADNAPVQLTPSQQGQASVHVTGGFQIATVEFSPSFEISSIILNSTGRSVNVQLPGAGPSAIEGAPVFDIANVQLTGNGEIGMLQLSPQGASANRA